MEFNEIGGNCYVITFVNQGDRDRVLDRCPWLYDNYLFFFVLKMFDEMTHSHLLNFSSERFWI